VLLLVVTLQPDTPRSPPKPTAHVHNSVWTCNLPCKRPASLMDSSVPLLSCGRLIPCAHVWQGPSGGHPLEVRERAPPAQDGAPPGQPDPGARAGRYGTMLAGFALRFCNQSVMMKLRAYLHSSASNSLAPSSVSRLRAAQQFMQEPCSVGHESHAEVAASHPDHVTKGRSKSICCTNASTSWCDGSFGLGLRK